MRARPTASACQPVAGRRHSCRRREGEAAGWSQSPARPITQADLATLTEKVRRRVVRWFRMQRLLDADAASDMVAGVVELSPFDFLDRLADLVPPPRKHRHRYHGVFAPNHKLRSAVTALAIANVGKLRDAATGGRAVGGHAAGQDTTGDCCDLRDKPRSHDTSRIAWAKLMARVGEEFPLECPGCGGDIRLIAFITGRGKGVRNLFRTSSVAHEAGLLFPGPAV